MIKILNYQYQQSGRKKIIFWICKRCLDLYSLEQSARMSIASQ